VERVQRYRQPHHGGQPGLRRAGIPRFRQAEVDRAGADPGRNRVRAGGAGAGRRRFTVPHSPR
jgi:hypothetical protein